MFVHDVLSDDEAARNRVLSIMRHIQVRKITDFSSVESKSVEQAHCEKGEGCGVLVLLYEASNYTRGKGCGVLVSLYEVSH